MRSHIVLGICITVLLMASVASAATVWNPAANGIVPPATGDWGVGANWTNDVPGVADPKAVFNVADAAECVVSDIRTCGDFVQGDNGPGGVVRIVDGGNLNTTGGWMAVGYNNPATLIVEAGGVAHFAGHMWLGMHTGADADIILNGGTITGSQDFGLGWFFGPADDHGVARVHVNRGVLNIHHWDDANAIYGDSFIDIKHGTVNITNDGDQVDEVLAYAAAGKIRAWSGVGTLNVVHADGVTTITADHPLQQSPADSSIVEPGDVELSWTLPDPCVPGTPVTVDVYFTDDLKALEDFTNLEAIKVVSNESVSSVVVQTQPKTWYYWAVDTYTGDPNDPAFGPIFQLFADNVPPKADAGDDVTTWIDNGSADVVLAGSVTDIDPTTSLWTVVAEPNEGTAVIADPAQLDATVTLTETGTYVLQLEASDGEYSGSDTMTVNVFADSCEAAQSLPGYEPIPGDINLDCRVDQLDLDILQAHWLECNALDCNDVQ